MNARTSAARTASSITRTRGRNQASKRSTHRRRDPRPQLNLKLPADLIDTFRAFCASRGLSQRAAIEAALSAFMAGLPALASFQDTVISEEPEQLASAPAPTPAEVTEVRAGLERIFRERPSMLTEMPRLPNRFDANNVLRWARRADPDASTSGVVDFIACKVYLDKQQWRNWGGVVVAAGDYAPISRPVIPPLIAPVAGYGPSYGEWLAGRESTDDLWAEFTAGLSQPSEQTTRPT